MNPNASSDWNLIKRLLTYLAPYRWSVIGSLLFLIIARCIEVWVPIQIGFLAQKIINDTTSSPKELLTFSLTEGVWLMSWIIIGLICDALSVWIKSWVGQHSVFDLRMQVYTHVQRLPVRFYDQNAIGKLMTRTIHDVDQINQLFTESVVPLLGSLFLFAAILGGVFFLNWRIGVLATVFLPLIWGLMHYFRANQRRGYEAIRQIIGNMNAFVQEHLMGAEIVRTFNLHRRQKQYFDRLNEDHFQANVATVHYFSLFFSGVEFLQSFLMIAIFAILTYVASASNHFEVGTFLTLNIYSLMIFRPLIDLAERYNILQSAMAAADKIFDILDQPEESRGAQPGLSLLEIKTIQFKDVWFAYKNEDWVLKGLSFTLNQGESTALIGTTGSGKTSVVNLLLRFYDFQKGEILINGSSLHDYSVASIRHQFSIILQDPVIFSGTIAQNISLYDPSISWQDIEQSAQYVQLLPVVAKMPGHLKAVIRERGGGLSVGEMQLVALARAMAHRRSILIFDEATANIDLKTEKVIQDVLNKILHTQTTLVIAHRLSTVRNVTVILVLHEGKVAEKGSHQQLLAARGIYEKLYRLQFPFS